MSRDQRVRDNHALLLAQMDAIKHGLPLAVVFCLTVPIGYRAREHYDWMLVGLKEAEKKLETLNIPLLMVVGDPLERLQGLESYLRPKSVYFDFSPLKPSRRLQKSFAGMSKASVFVVDTHNIVPVWLASEKQELGARTLRPKIHKRLQEFLEEPPQPQKHSFSWPGKIISISDLEPKISGLIEQHAQSNGQIDLIKYHPTGDNHARKRLQSFLDTNFAHYADLRNDPSADGLSGLSPYLHFGRISSARVIIEAQKLLSLDPSLQRSFDVLVEEMVVRKELSDNYCFYNSNYRSLQGAPQWAQRTLAKHEADQREFIYSKEEFEQAMTHDPAWNAAQTQLRKSGKIHGYMRMYWAKKVLEWSASPEEALETLVYLNDFYSLDGGDPNGYVGILWSIAGLHDRPWRERSVYGTVRSMVYGGLKRKFDIGAYESRWL